MGMLGQQHAEAFLVKKGLRILARNYRAKTGEIDLIAQAGTYFVFIEVKSRASLRYGQPREAVTQTKQGKIIRTAQQYITYRRLGECDMRFDVIEVLFLRDNIHIKHIENAFWA